MDLISSKDGKDVTGLEGVAGLGQRRLGSGEYGWRKACVGVSQQGRQQFKPITAGDLLAVRTLPTRVKLCSEYVHTSRILQPLVILALPPQQKAP